MLPEQVFHLVVEYVPGYDLPKIASVCKAWKDIADKSYWRRVNKPWILPSVPDDDDQSKNEFVKVHPASEDVKPGLKALKKKREDWSRRKMFIPNLHKDGDKWRFCKRDDSDYWWPRGPYVYLKANVAAIFPLLPLEKDLPSLLQHEETCILYCTMIHDMMLLIVSRRWSLLYHKELKLAGLVDHYQGEPIPGWDVWGMLYHVPTTKNDGSKPTPPRLVDVQRLSRCDFTYFMDPCFAERSENGKVFCFQTGLRSPNNPESCIPTVVTLTLCPNKGIQQQIPLMWPIPEGLEDTYWSTMTLTPSGDHLFATYSDKSGNLNETVFYKLKRDDNSESEKSHWEMLWKDDDEENDADFKGFFTIDGDFVALDSGYYQTYLPGPLAAKKVLVLEPGQHWLKNYYKP